MSARAVAAIGPRLRAIRSRRLLACLPLLAGGCLLAPGAGIGVVRVLGATETVRVEEAGLDFLARVDTGARACSIHALDLEIDDEAPLAEHNLGKRIRFRLVNERGQSAQLSGVITSVVGIRSAQGSEIRYAVALHLAARGVRRRVEVNLRDRDDMPFKLLIGRDWLEGRFLVDVGRNAVD